MASAANRSRRVAVVFIPGMNGVRRDEIRDKLCSGLIDLCEQGRVRPSVEDTLLAGHGRRLEIVTGGDQAPVQCDVYEAFWHDLVETLSEQALLRRFAEGSRLMLFWSRAMGTRFKRGWVAWGMFNGAFALLLWYVSILGAALTFLVSYVQSQAVFETFGEWIGEGAAGSIRDGLLDVATHPGLTAFFVALAGIITLFNRPIEMVVNVAYFTKNYLTRDRLRIAVSRRASDLLQRIDASGGYERVLLISHSLGTIAAIDLLADLDLPEASLDVVTLGSPCEVFGRVSPWLREELDRAERSPAVHSWLDMASPEDWLCSGIPLPDGKGARFESIQIRFPAGRWRQMKGDSHVDYFEQQEVMQRMVQKILAP